MSSNGRILAGIIERNALCVVNGIKDKAQGVITRKRNTVDRIEESAIDLVLTSWDMVNSIVSIEIDEKKDKVLTSITKTKKGVVRRESDHNSIVTKFNMEWEKKD